MKGENATSSLTNEWISETADTKRDLPSHLCDCLAPSNEKADYFTQLFYNWKNKTFRGGLPDLLPNADEILNANEKNKIKVSRKLGREPEIALFANVQC